MSAADAPDPEEVHIAATLRDRARAFDASSLLDLLAKRFPDRPIVAHSHPSLHPEATIFDAVEVRDDRIEIGVNLGLRSSDTPLPSYFLELLADPGFGERLAALIAQLDAGLLPSRLAAHHLDAGDLLPLRPTEQARGRMFSLAQPASPSTLHWLFAAVFPEIEVRVTRSPLVRIMPADEARLGEAVIGVASLGGEAAVPVNGFDAVLRVRDSATWGNVPWRVEAHRRVGAHVLPALAGTATYLRVLLVDLEGQGRLALGPGSGSYLGFDPLVSAAAPLVTVVFDGAVPAAPAIAEALDFGRTP